MRRAISDDPRQIAMQTAAQQFTRSTTFANDTYVHEVEKTVALIIRHCA